MHLKSNISKGARYPRPRFSTRNQLHLLHSRADLRVLIHVMEHDKSLHPLDWQIASLKQSLVDIERQINERRDI